jgi:hypothetical protein
LNSSDANARRIGAVVDITHVKGIDVELQPELVMEPLKELHVQEGLGFCRALVLAVDPVEVVGLGGSAFVGPGKNAVIVLSSGGTKREK